MLCPNPFQLVVMQRRTSHALCHALRYQLQQLCTNMTASRCKAELCHQNVTQSLVAGNCRHNGHLIVLTTSLQPP